MFLGLTGEEAGLLGSDYFASHPTVPLRRIIADLNIDMPTLTYRFEDLIAFGAERSSLGSTVRAVAARYDLALSPDPEPDFSLFARSDQFSFARRGVPSIMIWPGRKGAGGEATDLFMRSHYHHPSDDLHQPIRWDQARRA